MAAQTFTATVSARRQLAGDYFEVSFVVDGPSTSLPKGHTAGQATDSFDFQPGQFVTVKVPGETLCMRAYSIASAPQGNTFDLCVVLVHGQADDGTAYRGAGSGYLADLQVGDTVEMMGPSGVLPFDEAATDDLLLCGTGTGIAPLKAMIERLTELGSSRKIQLYFGLRYAADAFYEEEFLQLAERNSNFSFTIGISRPDDDCRYEHGRLPELLAEDIAMGVPMGTTSYICGGRTASEGIRNKLTELGQPADTIHVEGYGE